MPSVRARACGETCAASWALAHGTEKWLDVFRTFAHFASCFTEALADGRRSRLRRSTARHRERTPGRGAELASGDHLGHGAHRRLGGSGAPSEQAVRSRRDGRDAGRVRRGIAAHSRSSARTLGDQGRPRRERAVGGAPAGRAPASRRRARRADSIVRRTPCGSRSVSSEPTRWCRAVRFSSRGPQGRRSFRSSPGGLGFLRYEISFWLPSRSRKGPRPTSWPGPRKRQPPRWSSSFARIPPNGSISAIALTAETIA